MIRSFRNRALKRFWERSDASGLRADWISRITRQLDALEQASRPEDLDVPGNRFHALKGDQVGRYAISVSRNWRITFGWSDDALDIDLEDYHGR